MRKTGLLNPLILLICWTGLVGAGTCVLIENTVRQHLAEQFPTTRGRIIRSEMGEGHMSRRGIEIEYTYVVNGAKYHGHRYRYDDHNMTLEWQSSIVENPRWSYQKVYYNPRDPADSVLLPGVDGGDLLLLLFALPIAVFTATLWQAMLTVLRDRFSVGLAGGVRISKRKGQTRVALGETTALGTAFYAMAIAAFFAAFPVVIVGGFDPSMQLIEAVWAWVGVVGVVAFAWRMIKNCSGIYDLRINQMSGEVTLPQTAGRRQHVSILAAEISGISILRRVHRTPSGIHSGYLPALVRHRSGDEPMKLIAYGWSEQKAAAFAHWLGLELGVPLKGIEDEKQEPEKNVALLAPLNPQVPG